MSHRPPPDPDTDPFRPPPIPTEVFCLHCGREYDSSLIEWVEEDGEDGPHGFWCCPTPGCDGKGFGFDILPTDPDWRDEDGERMCFDDGEEEDDEDEDDFADLGPINPEAWAEADDEDEDDEADDDEEPPWSSAPPRRC